MTNKKKNFPFFYQRGNVKLSGNTDDDRKAMRMDTILYWISRIILLLTILIATILKIFL
jgi:hypothetical protein